MWECFYKDGLTWILAEFGELADCEFAAEIWRGRGYEVQIKFYDGK